MQVMAIRSIGYGSGIGTVLADGAGMPNGACVIVIYNPLVISGVIPGRCIVQGKGSTACLKIIKK